MPKRKDATVTAKPTARTSHNEPKRAVPALSREEQSRLTELQAWKAKQEARPAPPEEVATRNEAANERTRARRKSRRLAPKTDVLLVDGTIHMGSPYKDDAGYTSRICDIFGSVEHGFIDMLQMQLLNATGAKAGDQYEIKRAVDQSMAFMAGVAPENEIEASLAAQMYAVHSAAMNVSRLMHKAEMRDQYRDYGSLLVKTTRTFAAQVEALAKLRSGGKQQVEVRYVYVDARGGQNIIGSDVHTGGRGAGAIEHQPHGPAVSGLPFAPGVSMWGPDARGDAMPVASNPGTETLSDARRGEPGCPDGKGERELQARPADAGTDCSEADDPGARQSRSRGAR